MISLPCLSKATTELLSQTQSLCLPLQHDHEKKIAAVLGRMQCTHSMHCMPAKGAEPVLPFILLRIVFLVISVVTDCADPLRILRALRFAARFSFELDMSLQEAASVAEV